MSIIETEIRNQKLTKENTVPLDSLTRSMRRLSESGIIPPDLLKDPCRTVNPELVDFLDGDGKPGYAVSYEEAEGHEPGTVIEMNWEKQHLARHVAEVLSTRHLHTDTRDILMVEIGTAPALGSLKGLWNPLIEQGAKLADHHASVITADISWEMSGLGAITLEKTMSESQTKEFGIHPDMYAVHADGFHLIENIPDDHITVISAPFGILGFGLGERSVDDAFALAARKLEPGGIVSMNGYTDGWKEYADTLKNILHATIPENKVEAVYRSIVPFVIDIYEEEGTGRSMMSVGNGKGFPCSTHNPEDIAATCKRQGLKVLDVCVTPAGYCLIPKAILGQYEYGSIPDAAELIMQNRQYISKLLGDVDGGGIAAGQIMALQEKVLASGTAPYYTITGRKI